MFTRVVIDPARLNWRWWTTALLTKLIQRHQGKEIPGYLMTVPCDILIVGAGVLGVSAAYHLAQRASGPSDPAGTCLPWRGRQRAAVGLCSST